MSSLPVGGFALHLGHYYNDGWYNSKPPKHMAADCTKCPHRVTVHDLEKQIFAFGNIITKFCTIHTCPVCLHEIVAIPPKITKKARATKPNLLKLFAKLPKSVQEAMLKGPKR